MSLKSQSLLINDIYSLSLLVGEKNRDNHIIKWKLTLWDNVKGNPFVKKINEYQYSRTILVSCLSSQSSANVTESLSHNQNLSLSAYFPLMMETDKYITSNELLQFWFHLTTIKFLSKAGIFRHNFVFEVIYLSSQEDKNGVFFYLNKIPKKTSTFNYRFNLCLLYSYLSFIVLKATSTSWNFSYFLKFKNVWCFVTYFTIILIKNIFKILSKTGFTLIF